MQFTCLSKCPLDVPVSSSTLLPHTLIALLLQFRKPKLRAVAARFRKPSNIIDSERQSEALIPELHNLGGIQAFPWVPFHTHHRDQHLSKTCFGDTDALPCVCCHLHLLLIFSPVFVRLLLATTSIAQGFSVALFSGITPGGLKVELGLAMCKISALPAGTGFCQFLWLWNWVSRRYECHEERALSCAFGFGTSFVERIAC